MQQLTNNVFVETGVRGCNPGFVITSEGVVLIDTPFETSVAREWEAQFAKWGGLRYVINTESHLDHTLNNVIFPGTVIAHQATRAAILATNFAELRELIKPMYRDPLHIPEDHHLKAPTITFSERLTVFLGSHAFELINLPGHTAGQTAVYIPQEHVVFTGDNVFYHIHTFFQEALPERWLESLKALEELDLSFIVPGHGEVTDRTYLKEQASIIRGWVEAVRKAKAAGLGLDEALDKGIFLDPYPVDTSFNPAMVDILSRVNLARLYEVITP